MTSFGSKIIHGSEKSLLKNVWAQTKFGSSQNNLELRKDFLCLMKLVIQKVHKKLWVQNNFQSKIIFSPKFFFAPINLLVKKGWSKNYWVRKFVGSIKMLVQNNFGPKKILDPKKLGQKILCKNKI